MDGISVALEHFIGRVAEGRGSDEEVRIFPQVLQLFFDYAMSPRVKADPKTALSLVPPAVVEENETEFPPRGSGRLVDGLTAALFLGFSKEKHKRPEKAVKRLADEGKLPQPTRVGTRTYRWNSNDIWELRDRIQGQGGDTSVSRQAGADEN